MTPTLGLALIAKDEADCLPRLLASINGAFDQVALLDTGSGDATVAIFEEWARVQDLPLGWRVGHFDWVDDFAAARNAADDLLETDWLCWADADDEIVGARRLRPGLAEQAATGAAGLVFDYLAAGGELGPCRMRARARSLGIAWEGRLHEGLDQDEVPASAMRVIPHGSGVYWLHRAPFKDGRGERNLRILRRWIAEEPDDPRPHAMLAEILIDEGEQESAATALERYLDLRQRTHPDQQDARAALGEFRSAENVSEADRRLVLGRILARPSGAVGCRTRGEKEAGLSRQQRRQLARERAKEQDRIQRIAERSGQETIRMVHAA